MTALRMATSELRRITAGKLPKLAVLALALVPLLYASLYLYANEDPYDNLKNVPAALVVQDTGATSSGGKHLDAGHDVADELMRGRKFDWRLVDASDAEEGVRKNEYSFALTLPRDFSQSLLSPGEFKPRQGVIVLTTNDANNYLGSTIANQVVSEVRRSVSVKAGAEAADELLLGFATIRQKTAEAVDGARQLAEGTAQTRDGAARLADGQQTALSGSQQLADGAVPLADGAAKVSAGLRELRDSTGDLPAKSRQLADGAKQVSDGNEQVARTAEDYAAKAQALVDELDQVGGDIAARLRATGLPETDVQRVVGALEQARKPVDDVNGKVQSTAGSLRTLAGGAKQVSDGAAQLAAQTPALTRGIAALDDGARQVASGNAELRDGVVRLRDGEQDLVGGTNRLRDGTVQLADGSAKLRDGLAAGVEQIPNPDDPTRQSTARTIGDPVSVHGLSQSTAGSYGAGLAPFFLCLATWIGAFVLFLLLRPLSRRALASGESAVRVALGGWLPGAVLGVVQVAVMSSVVTLVIGIKPSNPIGTIAFLILTSLTFIAILHALNALLGAVGKFVGLVLLILQLVSAGGTFPWQTIPAPLHPLHHGLPMGYAVDGLRHLMYGGDLGSVGRDVLVLIGYLVLGLALSSLAAYKQRVWTPSRLKPELVL
ncbi:MAG TPA: YhgE/Pip domain-containing protein [Pseudonocardiaceae bacterium]|nr:YhgE/Pip domain-containing protein [Pseudonocardiaceae bacterium]